MSKQILVRLAGTEDYDAIADVMFEAVRYGSSAYSEEQRRAWVPQRCTGADWIQRLESQTIFAAEVFGQIVGFMSLAGHGYIDFAFVCPSAQGSGIFRRLYNAVENLAMQGGERRLWVHSSVTAQPAFTAMGFAVIERETVKIGEQSLQRFVMEKHLDFPHTGTRA